MIAQFKHELRKELLVKRRKLCNNPELKRSKDKKIFTKLNALPEFTEADLVLTYMSTEIEVDTAPIIKFCHKNSISVAVPVIFVSDCDSFEMMEFFCLTKDFDLDCSEAVDCNPQNSKGKICCIVPALAFESKENSRRLGYGGGYYDRFLRANANLSKIGLCYSEFINNNLPIESHDEYVDIVITD